MVITYPPEMLPTADGPADVFVENSDGSRRLVRPMEEVIMDEVRRQGRADILELADAVARETCEPLRMIDRTIRMMIQQGTLLQDTDYKVFRAVE